MYNMGPGFLARLHDPILLQHVCIPLQHQRSITMCIPILAHGLASVCETLEDMNRYKNTCTIWGRGF